MIPVQVVGLGMSPADLTPTAQAIIREAQVLAGGRRLLDYFPQHRALKIALGKDPAGTLKQLAGLAAAKRVVVLASGDPNFYGIGPLVVQVLGAEHVVLHPNLTAVQAACARLQIAWQEAHIISLHGRTWEPLDGRLRPAGSLDHLYGPGPYPRRDCPGAAGPGVRTAGPPLRSGRPGAGHGAGHLPEPGRGPRRGTFHP